MLLLMMLLSSCLKPNDEVQVNGRVLNLKKINENYLVKVKTDSRFIVANGEDKAKFTVVVMDQITNNEVQFNQIKFFYLQNGEKIQKELRSDVLLVKADEIIGFDISAVVTIKDKNGQNINIESQKSVRVTAIPTNLELDAVYALQHGLLEKDAVERLPCSKEIEFYTNNDAKLPINLADLDKELAKRMLGNNAAEIKNYIARLRGYQVGVLNLAIHNLNVHEVYNHDLAEMRTLKSKQGSNENKENKVLVYVHGNDIEFRVFVHKNDKDIENSDGVNPNFFEAKDIMAADLESRIDKSVVVEYSKDVRNLSPGEHQIKAYCNIGNVKIHLISRTMVVVPKFSDDFKIGKIYQYDDVFLGQRNVLPLNVGGLKIKLKNAKDIILHTSSEKSIEFGVFVAGEDKTRLEVDLVYSGMNVGSIIINVNLNIHAPMNISNWNGFHNFGNICYMNAGLKAFLASLGDSIHDFAARVDRINYLDERIKNNRVKFIKFLGSFADAMNLKDGFNKEREYEIVLETFMNLFNGCGKDFVVSKWEQKDAGEFIVALMDILDIGSEDKEYGVQLKTKREASNRKLAKDILERNNHLVYRFPSKRANDQKFDMSELSIDGDDDSLSPKPVILEVVFPYNNQGNIEENMHLDDSDTFRFFLDGDMIKCYVPAIIDGDTVIYEKSIIDINLEKDCTLINKDKINVRHTVDLTEDLIATKEFDKTPNVVVGNLCYRDSKNNDYLSYESDKDIVVTLKLISQKFPNTTFYFTQKDQKILAILNGKEQEIPENLEIKDFPIEHLAYREDVNRGNRQGDIKRQSLYKIINIKKSKEYLLPNVKSIMSLEMTSNKLFMFLGRFIRNNERGESLKIYNPVLLGDEHKFNGLEYNVVSDIMHGGSFSGGHYWAHIKHENGEWYEHNDSYVTPLKDPKRKSNVPDHQRESSEIYGMFLKIK